MKKRQSGCETQYKNIMCENKDIDYRFKILYALGIFMVVSGHVQGMGEISFMDRWFPYGGVHLPLFVFCSGYFYKRQSIEHTGKYVVKKIRKLIIPLYIYTIAYGIIVQITKSRGFTIGGDFTLNNILINPITNGHQFIYNMGGWFVIPLFMVELYNILLRKLVAKLKINASESYFFILSIILGVIGNQLACTNHIQNWWLVLVRMMYFIPFYGLGIFYKNVLEKYERKIPGIWYFAIIFGLKLSIIVIYGKSPAYTPSWCNDFVDGPVMPVIIGYLGIAFWVRISTILEPTFGRNKYINLIADSTYSIMMNQFLGFMIIKTIYAFLNKYFDLFKNFDWTSYKTDIWWYYMPRNVMQTGILYIIAGIVFPICLQEALHFLQKFMVKRKEKNNF